MTLPVAPYQGAAAAWDALVRSAAGATHCHLHGWRDVMREAFGHECPYLAAWEENGRLAGVLPLVRVRSRLFGHYLVSLPFLNYGGPLGSDAAIQALAAHGSGLARAGAATLLELRSRVALPLDLAVSHRKITVVRNIPGGPEVLWKQLDSKVRSQVRRAEKEGATVAFGPDQLEGFYAVFARHMRDLGTPVLARGVFETIARVFPEDTWFGVVWLGARPVAGGCGFRFGDEFEMTWASALHAYSRLAPNMLLYWKFMERCAAQGVRVFNFGRCTPGSGTHRFKQQWGSRDVPLYWYQWGAERVNQTPSPDHGRYAWAVEVWKRLPLPVANALGPRIVRLIP